MKIKQNLGLIHFNVYFTFYYNPKEFYFVLWYLKKTKSFQAWMERESIMLSEISHRMKDKHHMISPISGT